MCSLTSFSLALFYSSSGVCIFCSLPSVCILLLVYSLYSLQFTLSMYFTPRGRSRIFVRRGCTSREWRHYPGFFSGGGAPLRNDVTDRWGKIINYFKSQYEKEGFISGGGGGAHPLNPPPRSTPVCYSRFLSASEGSEPPISDISISLSARRYKRCLPFGDQMKIGSSENFSQHALRVAFITAPPWFLCYAKRLTTEKAAPWKETAWQKITTTITTTTTTTTFLNQI